MAEVEAIIGVDDHEVKAMILHKGRGKFRIVRTRAQSLVGRVIDASDIISCEDPDLIHLRAAALSRRARSIFEKYLEDSISEPTAKRELVALVDMISL
jgi:hypothetical protein